MQFKTPESALQAKSQESAQVPKTYSPHNGSSARAAAMSPKSSKPTASDASDLAAFETQFGQQVTAGRHSIKEMSRDLVDRARQAATATDDYVRAQPWKAIGIGAAIGAAIGVALGVLFARR